MRDQFIAGLTSEPVHLKLIGKGHRHRDMPQAKVTLQEVVEVAKSHEATTFEGLSAKRAYIEFWPIFIFCRIELIFGRLTCFDMKSIVL